MFKETEYLFLISGKDIWSAGAVTDEYVASKSTRVSNIRKDGARELDAISEGNGYFPECLSELMEADKIDASVELLCENEHSQTNINKEIEEESSIEDGNFVDKGLDDFETLRESLLVDYDDLKLPSWS